MITAAGHIGELPRPRLRVLDVVPAVAVAASIDEAERRLGALTGELAATLAEAEALEALAGTDFDRASFEFIAVRLHRFVDDLRVEARAMSAAVMSTAGRAPELPEAPEPVSPPMAPVRLAFPAASASLTPADDGEIEQAFWADAAPEHDQRRHFFRMSRAVVLQGVALLLVLAAVLIRIG